MLEAEEEDEEEVAGVPDDVMIAAVPMALTACRPGEGGGLTAKISSLPYSAMGEQI